MKTHRTRLLCAALAALTLLGGCAGYGQRIDCATGRHLEWNPVDPFPLTPRLDCAFGNSVNMAVARQLIDIDAAARNAGRTAAGMDGLAAKEAMDRYQKSFRAPEPAASVFTIGIGTGQGFGSGQ